MDVCEKGQAVCESAHSFLRPFGQRQYLQNAYLLEPNPSETCPLQ